MLTEYHYQVWAGRVRGQIRCVYKGTDYQQAVSILQQKRELGYIAQLDRWTFEHGTDRWNQEKLVWERV